MNASRWLVSSWVACSFSLVLALGADAAFAQDASPPRFATPRVAAVHESCFARTDWSQVKCEYGPSGWDAHQMPHGPIAGMAQAMDAVGDYAVDPLLDSLSFLLSGKERKRRKLADQIFGEIRTMMLDAESRYRITPCQAACVVTCVTSHIAGYAGEALNDISSTRVMMLVDNQGRCQDYTRLGRDLGRVLGLDMKSVTTGTDDIPHAVIGVKLDGVWQAIEPQARGCHFFQDYQTPATSG